MLDAYARGLYRPAVDRLAEHATHRGIGAPAVTAAGLAAGVACCVAVALGQWPLALAL